MTSNNISTSIKNVQFRKYKTNKFFFAYPDGGKFAEFTHPNNTKVIRLVYDYQGVQFRVDLEQAGQKGSAYTKAIELYESSVVHPENKYPTKVPSEHVEIWCLRRLFIEGGKQMLLIDTAFIQRDLDVYQLQYGASIENHKKGIWIFEIILDTLGFSS